MCYDDLFAIQLPYVPKIIRNQFDWNKREISIQ